MLDEIHEQPEVWDRLCASSEPADVGHVLARRRPRLVLTVARGSSDNAALYGRYLAHLRLGLPAGEIMPSVHTVWGRPGTPTDACVIAVSQSGASPDIVSTVELMRAAGHSTVAITNDVTSDLARAAEFVVPLWAGTEVAVAATKTYTASLLALRLLIGALAGEEARDRAALAAGLRRSFDQAVGWTTTRLQQWSETLHEPAVAHLVARGPSLATAREGALKLTETCRMTAQGWSAADMQHGPMAAVGSGTPLLAFDGGRAHASVRDVMRAAAGRGAPVLSVTPGGTALAGQEEDVVPAETVPLQLLAHTVARARGLDPDRPVGLQKVTRTR